MQTFNTWEEKPVIIIAAARSGTKMLRSALSATPELVCFPYDIDYTWKYGNYHIPHDELTKEDLTDKTKEFIRKQFKKLLLKSNAERVLEKTVSNSLRVDFVRAVFPDCQIIHLYRDGRDVAASTKLYGQSQKPKEDLFKKMANVPLRAWPYLLNDISKWASLYVNRLFYGTKPIKSWGPRFKGIDESFKKYSLLEVCGIQWARSIELSCKHLSALKENEDYINIRYEDLVQNPIKELQRAANFLQISNFDLIKEYAENKITDNYIGSWNTRLSSDEIEKLLPHISKHLILLGYK